MALEVRQRMLAQASLKAISEGYSEITLMQHHQMADGYLNRYGIREGFELLLFDFLLDSPINAVVDAPAGLLLAFVLEGDGQITLAGQDGNSPGNSSIAYGENKSIIAASSGPMKAQSTIRTSKRFRGAELRLNPNFLELVGMADLIGSLDVEHPLAITAQQNYWFGEQPMPDQIIDCVESLLSICANMPGNDFNLEARALDMLRLSLDCLGAHGDTHEPTQHPDAQSIENARRLMLEDLSHNWTVKELASHVKLNEKRLQEGFRSQYGHSVFRHLQKLRLDTAHSLLRTGSMGVTEVSLQVGYSNPSRFSELFKREFGIQPSKLFQKTSD